MCEFLTVVHSAWGHEAKVGYIYVAIGILGNVM
jgi:hypothetical protein